VLYLRYKVERELIYMKSKVVGTGYEHDIEVNGQYVYINDHCINMQTEEAARQFVIDLIKEGVLDR
jgi:hypothetical protein